LIVYTGTAFTQDKRFELHPKALDIAVYNPHEVVKYSYQVLYGEDAENAVGKILMADEDLIQRFWGDNDNVSMETLENEILKYYPEAGVFFYNTPVTMGIFDIKNKRDIYGDPLTYAYSPSGRYRFSSLDDDGLHYYLEEKIDGEYRLKGTVNVEGIISGFYWVDEETIYYLRERSKYDGSRYWVAYSSRFFPVQK